MSAILVTGATGIVGSAVVEHLHRKGEQVIATVGTPAEAATVPSGVSTRTFEFGAPRQQLDDVLDGVDRVFLMRPPQIEDVRTYLFPFIDACQRAAVRQIVFLSLQGVQFNTKTPHHAVEQYLTANAAPYTSLRPNFFMQNLSSTYAADIRDNDEIYLPAGRAFTALIDARDIGRVAAVVFTQPGHIGKAYTLSGEQSLTYKKVARILSDVLGRRITYVRPSEEAYLSRLGARGQPEDYIAVQKMIYRLVRYNVSALPNRTVRKLTGQPATSFRQFALDYQAIWRPVHRQAGGASAPA